MAHHIIDEVTPREPHRPRLASVFRRGRPAAMPDDAAPTTAAPDAATNDEPRGVAASGPGETSAPAHPAAQDGAPADAVVVGVSAYASTDAGSTHIVVSNRGSSRVDELLVRLTASEDSEGTALALRTPMSSLLPGESVVAHVPPGRPESFVNVSWVHDGEPGRMLVALG